MKGYLLFFLTVILVYALMHLAPYYLLSTIFPRYKKLSLILLIGLLPFILRFLDDYIYLQIIRPLWLLAYIWIGFIFYLFLFSCTLILIKLAINSPNLMKFLFILCNILCISITFYAYINTTNIKTTKYFISSSKINREYKILFLSDMHIHVITNCDRIIKNLSKMIKTESPDIIILGRDIFESNLKFIKKDIRKIFGLFKGHYVFFLFLEIMNITPMILVK